VVSETAIVAEVPEAEPVLRLTSRGGAAEGAAGMPVHVTLLYPFAESARLDARRLREVENVVGAFPAFEVEFAETAWFETRDRAVLWLKPRPPEPFVAITEALVRAFPEHPPYAGAFDSIVPHLTVAAATSRAELRQIERAVLEHLPLVARIPAAQLYEHRPEGWRLRAAFPLHDPTRSELLA